MIHNLMVTEDEIQFTVITEVGKCDVKVDLCEFSFPETKPLVYVTDYVILGQPTESIEQLTKTLLNENTMAEYEVINNLYSEALRRICSYISEICDNNSWKLWSY